jgi:hypothetical protein
MASVGGQLAGRTYPLARISFLQTRRALRRLAELHGAPAQDARRAAHRRGVHLLVAYAMTVSPEARARLGRALVEHGSTAGLEAVALTLALLLETIDAEIAERLLELLHASERSRPSDRDVPLAVATADNHLLVLSPHGLHALAHGPRTSHAGLRERLEELALRTPAATAAATEVVFAMTLLHRAPRAAHALAERLGDARIETTAVSREGASVSVGREKREVPVGLIARAGAELVAAAVTGEGSPRRIALHRGVALSVWGAGTRRQHPGVMREWRAP